MPLQRISQLPQATELTGSEAMAVVQDGETRQAPAVGLTGPQGESIELQVTSTHIQWRYPEGTWTDLIALSELEGEQGIQGEPGEDGAQGEDGAGLEFNWDGTQLGVRVEGETTFTYVDLEGPQGIQGEQGPPGEDGADGEQGPPGEPGEDGAGIEQVSDFPSNPDPWQMVALETDNRTYINTPGYGWRRIDDQVTVGTTEPSDPLPGDLWVNPEEDFEITPGVGLQLDDDLEVLGDGTPVAVPWGATRWSETEMRDPAEPTRIYITHTGVYNIVASLRNTGDRDGVYCAYLRVNGDSGYRRGSEEPGREFQFIAQTSLAAGDYIEIVVAQHTGTAENLIAGSRTALTVSRMGGVLV